MFRFTHVVLISVLSLLFGNVQADVRFASPLERSAGTGYNAKSTNKRVQKPNGILKKARVQRQRVKHTRVRNLRARQAKMSTRKASRVRSSASRVRAAAPRVQFDTAARRAGSGYNNVRYDRRVVKPKSILKGTRANQVVRSERAFTKRLGATTRGTMTHRGQVARHARHSTKYKSTLARTGKYAKHGRKLRTVGKIAGGGIVSYGAQKALGVKVPDAYDATAWTYNTLKNPKKAPQRIQKLGRDSVKTVSKGVRTITNPKKMVRNVDRGVKDAARTINKAGCSAAKLFGARC